MLLLPTYIVYSIIYLIVSILVLLIPDLSFDEHVKRHILTIVAEHMNKPNRCIFNNRTSQYELTYIVTNDDISYIDWKTYLSYSDADYFR